MKKIIFKNTSFQIFSKVATSSISFLIAILIARNFGVLGFGDFTKITAFVAPLYLVVDFGLNAIFLQKEDSRYFADFFSLRLLISFCLFFILSLILIVLPLNKEFNLAFPPLVRLGIFIFSLTLFTYAISVSSAAIFQKKFKYSLFMTGNIIGSVLTLSLVVLYIFFHLNLNYIITAFVIGSLVSSFLMLFWTKQNVLPLSFNKQFIRELLKDSFPLGLMLFFNLVYFRSDIFLLSFLKSTKDVGIYGLSFKFFDFLIALPLFLSNSLYPILLENLKNPRKFNIFVKNYILVYIFSSLILIIPFWFFSPFFRIIKEDFVSAIVPFRILLLSLPVFFITSFLQWVLIAKRQQRYLMAIYIVSFVLNVFLNFIFIPYGSYVASAIITGVSEFLVLIFLILRLYSIEKNLQRQHLI
ncbi:MAG: oligosaccharide flippase family protein [Patescibacteria group bacterium]|nr:oligosaccharide flippase family protein [Patescibacteria group bacterium]